MWRSGHFPEGDVARISGLKILKKDTLNDADILDLKFECEGDLRGDLASVLVRSGATLLEIKKDSDDLETLFMNLVKAKAD